ncbi:MAG TPA: MFS transporter [Acidimicrobiia bacterium]|nr:MFS transporter [Acidimicrobiia bacterium]
MPDDPHGHGTFRAAFAHRDFRALIAHHAASATGQTLGTVAVTAAVWDQTASSGWVATAAAARLLPYIVVSMFAGVVADRRERRGVLAVSAGTRAVLVLALAAAVGLEAAPALLVGLTFLMTAAGTPCYPALAAAMPVVVPTEDLAPANGILTTIESSAFVVGPAIGGVVLLVAPAEIALVVNAAVFLLALACLANVGELGGGSNATRGDEGLTDALRAGVRAIVGSPDVMTPLVLVVVVNLVYGGSLIGLLLVATELLDAGRGGFGLLNAALGVGAFVGVALTNRVARTRAPMRALAGATMFTGIPFALLAIGEVLPVAIALMVISGIGSVVTEVLAVTLMQRSLPRDVLARVFGILDAVVIGAVLLGSAGAPALVDLIGLRASLVVVGAVVPVLGAVVATWMVSTRARQTVESAASEHDLGERVALLERVPWLRELVRPALESLARVADPVEIAAGVEIVREGDAPDDCFVVASGSVHVWQRGAAPAATLVATLGPGDGFGEVGLLEGRPRNATVRAATATRLLRIDGDEFLAAVNAVPAASGAALGGGFLGRVAPSVPDH